MKYLKANWLSVIAIVISAISLCSSFIRCEPFIFTDQLLTWIWTSAIGIIGIASAIALGGQIYSAMTIDRKIDRHMELFKEEVTSKIKELDQKSYQATYSMSMYIMAQNKAILHEYDDLLNCFIQAIRSAKLSGRPELYQVYAEQLYKILKDLEANNIQLKISKKDKIEYIKDLDGINHSDELSIYILKQKDA